jgi:hypothetical protein
MGTGEVPAGTDPSDITDEMLQSARRRAWELDLRPSASAATIAGALDWLRENPAELARLLGWEHRYMFGAKFDNASGTASVFRQHAIEGPLRPGDEDDVQEFAAHADAGYDGRVYY